VATTNSSGGWLCGGPLVATGQPNRWLGPLPSLSKVIGGAPVYVSWRSIAPPYTVATVALGPEAAAKQAKAALLVPAVIGFWCFHHAANIAAVSGCSVLSANS